jgi:hypothetical protein
VGSMETVIEPNCMSDRVSWKPVTTREKITCRSGHAARSHISSVARLTLQCPSSSSSRRHWADWDVLARPTHAFPRCLGATTPLPILVQRLRALCDRHFPCHTCLRRFAVSRF